MNEESEQFEQRLRRQPVKQIPPEWRKEILNSVAADVNRRQTVSREFTFAATGWSRLSTLLWPHPKAWAGLAAIWVLILTLNFSTQDKPAVLAAKVPPPSPEVLVELRQQQKMLAELIGPAELHVADRQPLFLPKPRSERAEILAT
jgi:hypothetical protein